MPGRDARDHTGQNSIPNPQIRDPYGHGYNNAGGSVLGEWSGQGGNSYGIGSVDYSGQARRAYQTAQETLDRAKQLQNTRYPAGANLPSTTLGSPNNPNTRYTSGGSNPNLPNSPPDPTNGNNNTGNGAEDYGRGDRANSENSDYPYRPPGGETDGFGNPIRTTPTTGGTGPNGSTSAPSGSPNSGYGGAGGWGNVTQADPSNSTGGATGAGGGYGGGGNAYGVPGPHGYAHPDISEDPRMQALLQTLNTSAGLDQKRAQQMFDLWSKKQGQGQKQEDYLSQMYGDVLGRSGKSYDPNNPATFALQASQMQDVAAAKDRQIEALKASGLTGPELAAAIAKVDTQAYGAGAHIRSDQVGKATDYFQNLANIDQHGFDPGQSSQAAQQMLGYYGQKYGTDVNAANQLYGVDVGAEMSKYGTDVGAAGQRYGTDTNAATSRYGTDKQYDLGLQQLKAQQDAAKNQQKQSMWAGLLNSLGGLKMPGGGSPGGGNGAGGGGNNSRSNYGGGGNSWDNGWDNGGTQSRSSAGPNAGQFLQEDGTYGNSSGTMPSDWNQDSWASGEYD